MNFSIKNHGPEDVKYHFINNHSYNNANSNGYSGYLFIFFFHDVLGFGFLIPVLSQRMNPWHFVISLIWAPGYILYLLLFIFTPFSSIREHCFLQIGLFSIDILFGSLCYKNSL